jgi:hypothetical protein
MRLPVTTLAANVPFTHPPMAVAPLPQGAAISGLNTPEASVCWRHT